jgi:predicted glycoside hydrolase/deacetylase ChbG (UPF0249 family)
MPWAIGVDHLVALLRALPPGVTELGCHPADGSDRPSMYRRERDLELRALCDPRVADAVASEGIRRISFHELAPTVV